MSSALVPQLRAPWLRLLGARVGRGTILHDVRFFNLYRRGLRRDILTVDNHVDGVYLYRKLLQANPQRAERVFNLLRLNGGGA